MNKDTQYKEPAKDIQDIEALYPIDSIYPGTNEVGKKLLIEAIEEFDWRKLSTKLLSLYAEKCRNEEFRRSSEELKRTRGHNEQKL